jgi:hypothetical protein
MAEIMTEPIIWPKYEREIKEGIILKPLSSWKEFATFIADPKQTWGTFIYRGQANADWQVVSTLDRLEKRFDTKPDLEKGIWDYYKCPRVPRGIQLDRFKAMALGRLSSHIPDDENDEWWALAQHHGMATPMLDWAYSPFVALYFAFYEEECDCNREKKKPDQRAVFALTHTSMSAKAEDGSHPKVVTPRWPGNYRLSSQGGLFLRMPYYCDGGKTANDLESYVRREFKAETYEGPKDGLLNLHPELALVKFKIPNNDTDRFECLRYLDHMNINRASLFPDLDGAAQYVNDLWEVNWEKAIGYTNDPSCHRTV